MTITTTLTLSPIDFSDKDGLSGVVTTVHWQCEATDGSETARIIGTEGLDNPDPEAFSAIINPADDAEGAYAQRAGWIGADRIAEIKSQAEAALTAQLARIAANAGTMA